MASLHHQGYKQALDWVTLDVARFMLTLKVRLWTPFAFFNGVCHSWQIGVHFYDEGYWSKI